MSALSWLPTLAERWSCRPGCEEPLRVTAVLESPVAIDPQHHVALDGVLQWLAVADASGMQPFEALGDFKASHADLAIPLHQVESAGRRIACVSHGRPTHAVGVVRLLRRRARIERMDLARVDTSTAEYKSLQIPLQGMLAWSIEWHVVGDRDRLTALLSRCHALGRGRSGGMGLVFGWRIEPVERDLSLRDESGQPARSLPVESAEEARRQFGDGVVLGVVPIRAPYWRRDSQTLCALPPRREFGC